MGNNLNDCALAPSRVSKQRGEVVYSYSGCLPIPRNLINNVSTLFYSPNYQPAKEETRGKKKQTKL